MVRRRRTRSAVVVAAVGLLVSLMTSGCSSLFGGSSSQRHDVAVVGDSITDQSKSQLAGSFGAAGWKVTAIDAQWGRRTTEPVQFGDVRIVPGVAAIRAIEDRTKGGDSEPEVWVVALGTNDAGMDTDVTRYPAFIADVLAAIPAKDTVYWVDVVIGRDSRAFAPGSPLRAVAFNQALADAASHSGGRLHVIPWTAIASKSGILSPDGVHVTTAGADARARQIVDRLTADLPRH